MSLTGYTGLREVAESIRSLEKTVINLLTFLKVEAQKQNETPAYNGQWGDH